MPPKSRVRKQDWPRIQQAARAATRNYIRSWQSSVALERGQVNGSTLTLPRNSFVYGRNLELELTAALPPATAYSTTARGWAKAVGEAWKRWIVNYQVVFPGAYPGFIAFPASYAPPTPNVPFPLSTGTSLSEGDLSLNRLRQAIKDAIGPQNYDEPNAATAVEDFAEWLSASFQAWRMTLSMQSIMGEGPVPTFAPPYVPAGPVVGKAWASPGFLIGILFPD